MRLHVAHETTYAYDEPASYAIQMLRVTPRSHDGQFVCRWRIDINADCRFARDEDSFANLTHTFTRDGPIETIVVAVEGEVETEDTGGIVRGTVERLPPAFYLRGTDVTAADTAIRTLAADLAPDLQDGGLAALHRLLRHLHEHFEHAPAGVTAARAAEALAAGSGTARDAAHLFVATALAMGVPARFVAGHLLPGPDLAADETGHAWAEVHVRGVGWIGFDPVNGVCVTPHHIRVATALDAAGASPVRGSRTGGGAEHVTSRLSIAPSVPFVRPLPKKRAADIFATGPEGAAPNPGQQQQSLARS